MQTRQSGSLSRVTRVDDQKSDPKHPEVRRMLFGWGGALAWNNLLSTVADTGRRLALVGRAGRRHAALIIPFGMLLIGCNSGSFLEVDAPSTSEYVIQRGDRLRIRIWPDSTLNGDYPVEEDGQAYLPVLGSLPVAGVPLTEVRGVLRTQYSEEMKDPTVSVTPLFRVSVLGAVQRPGLYEIDPTQGVIDAISMAGGFRENARENSVRIIRQGEVLELNAEEASGLASRSWQLQSGDRIIVPRGWGLSMRDVLYVLQGAALVLTLYGQTQD